MSTNDQTRFFFELTPERILDAVESAGLRCTGRCLALNSMENRVYELEIEVDDESAVKSPSDRFRVVKFYRPGRWTAAQIQEEHQFLLDLVEAEIPVVAPLVFPDGATLRTMEQIGIFFAVFPKQGGRSPDELLPGYAQQIGRLIARVHAVGAQRIAEHRLKLNVKSFGRDNLEFLLTTKAIPADVEETFANTVSAICRESEPLFEGVPIQRIHGDCHFGNVLWARDAAFLVDFDDMMMGPCVQDLWLVIPGTDTEARIQLSLLVEGYEEMREFDRRTLRLIEPLRALRMIHYAAWIARRWEDPAFQRAFTNFGTREYWRTLCADLNDQLTAIQEEKGGAGIWRI